MENKDVGYFITKKLLLATNALEQKGSAWVVNLRNPGFGIQSGQTFPTQDIAIDATHKALVSSYDKDSKVA